MPEQPVLGVTLDSSEGTERPVRVDLRGRIFKVFIEHFLNWFFYSLNVGGLRRATHAAKRQSDVVCPCGPIG